jgi:class 3 adenylate cyclase
MELLCARCRAGVPAGARFCPACAAPVGLDAGGGPADEARKLVTVLFADVTGSTALGERLDPERLRAVLQAWYAAASAAVEAWGGSVEKFIGDAIVAVFGVPAVREDDAERALRAALEILDRLPELNRRFQSQHGVELEVRIGVNSGEVIAPLAPAAGGPLVTGDAVNVAARLEQAADPGSILVGERTWLAARSAFGFGDPVALELKGKAEPVTARRLIAAAPESRRGIPGLSAPMVGRDRELDALVEALDRTLADDRPTLGAFSTAPSRPTRKSVPGGGPIGSRRPRRARRTDIDNVERIDRPAEPLERQRSEGLDSDQRFNLGKRPLVQHD